MIYFIMTLFQAFVFSYSFFILCKKMPFKTNKIMAYLFLFFIFYFIYIPSENTLIGSILRYFGFVLIYFIWSSFFVKIEKKYALFLSFFCTVLMGIWFSCFQLFFLFIDYYDRNLLIFFSGLARLLSATIFRSKIILIDENRTISYPELFVSIFPAMTCFLANLINFGLFKNLSSINITEKIQLASLTVFFAISALVVLSATEIYFRFSSLKIEAQQAEAQLTLQYQLFLKEKEKDEQLKAIHHDMKNHIEILTKLSKIDEVQEYVGKIKESTEHVLDRIDTGNIVLNILLDNKKQICKEKGIIFNTGIRFENTDFLSSMDVCSLFVNCIDNAIEAVEKVSGNKVIELAGGWINDSLVVRIQNPFVLVHELKKGKDELLSTKKGPGHGFGLRNVKRVIERYDGTLNINTNDNLFTVTWMIPKRENA